MDSEDKAKILDLEISLAELARRLEVLQEMNMFANKGKFKEALIEALEESRHEDKHINILNKIYIHILTLVVLAIANLFLIYIVIK